MFKGDSEGVLKGDLEGDSEVDLGGLQRGLQTGLGRGLAVKLRSGLVQVWSSSGPGLVQYRLKFNYFELDSEVGRLVIIIIIIIIINLALSSLTFSTRPSLFQMIHST